MNAKHNTIKLSGKRKQFEMTGPGLHIYSIPSKTGLTWAYESKHGRLLTLGTTNDCPNSNSKEKIKLIEWLKSELAFWLLPDDIDNLNRLKNHYKPRAINGITIH